MQKRAALIVGQGARDAGKRQLAQFVHPQGIGTYGSVCACSGKIGSIRAERDTVDIPGVAVETYQFLAGDHVPHLGEPIEAGRCQLSAILAEGETQDQPGMPGQRPRFLSRANIPECDIAVLVTHG